MIGPSQKSVAEFYDKLSVDYDAMTGSAKRLAREEGMFRGLVHRYGISSAVDAGCGTGVHACLLARLGVEVTGLDVSHEMLTSAAARAGRMGLKVTWVESTFGDMRTKIRGHVGAVFCLGNSLAHLLSGKEVLKALRSFRAVLETKGVLFLQILNYDAIMSRGLRVQSVKEEGDRLFIRFYDFERRRIRFNILKLRRRPDGFAHELDSVYVRPLGSTELRDSLATAGFHKITMFGNARLEKFHPVTSVDVFVVARK